MFQEVKSVGYVIVIVVFISHSACMFAVAFPLFIVSASDAKPEESTYVYSHAYSAYDNGDISDCI